MFGHPLAVKGRPHFFKDDMIEHPVTITYTLDMYEDREEINSLVNYRDAYSKLFDIHQICRTFMKHGDEEVSPKVEKIFDEILELSYVE